MSRRQWRQTALLLALLVATLGPSVALERARSQARTCFAAIEGVRTAALPDCSSPAFGFFLARWAPWTARAAGHLSEELSARWAVARYVDAAVGQPDGEALRARFDALWGAWRDVENGSGRLWFDDLGRGVAAPAPGALAATLGDRRALMDEGLRWTQWYTSTRAIEAALLNADTKRAARLAKHYLGRPNTDLRVRVGAMLCADGEPQRAMKQLVEVESGRAADRNANFWREFGAVRVVIEACSALAGEVPPAVPEYGYAGDWDHRERLLALRWRWARRKAGCTVDQADCGPDAGLSAAQEEIRQRLEGPVPLNYRLELVALIAPQFDDADRLEKLARQRPGEPRLAERILNGIDAWIDEPSQAQPRVPAAQFARAAAHIATQAGRSRLLRRLAGTLYQYAAKAWAAEGRGQTAYAVVGLGGDLLWTDAASRALNRSNLAWLLGDAAKARRALAPAARSEHSRASARAMLVLQRAILSLPDDRAAAQRGAEQAQALAQQANRPQLAERAAWWTLATSDPKPVKGAAGELAVSWPFLGPVDNTIPAAVRAADLERVLRAWRVRLATGSERRRAYRYQAVNRGGVLPAALPAYLLLAGRLVDEAGQIETWLDAFMASGQRGISLRRYAWARAEAARARGDQGAAALWKKRFRFLLALSQEPTKAELYQAQRL